MSAKAVTAAGAAAVWGILGFWPMVAAITLVWLAWVAYATFRTGPSRATPPAITRLPTRHEQERRWRLGFGLGLSLVGIFPFIVIRRR